jgi:hypothetical protein
MLQKLTLPHWGLLLHDREKLIAPLRSAGFHTIHEVRVKIHSDGGCGVAQSFLHDRRGSDLEEVRRVSVTELVELNVGAPT